MSPLVEAFKLADFPWTGELGKMFQEHEDVPSTLCTDSGKLLSRASRFCDGDKLIYVRIVCVTGRRTGRLEHLVSILQSDVYGNALGMICSYKQHHGFAVDDEASSQRQEIWLHG